MPIVVDSNLMLALVLRERHTEKAILLIDRWVEERIDLHTPLLAHYEIANVLTGKRARGEITSATVEDGLAAIGQLPIAVDADPDSERAVAIAHEMRRHKAYDAFYLELAERVEAELWTLDGPLARNAGDRYPVTLVE